jgi:hypothetical protein
LFHNLLGSHYGGCHDSSVRSPDKLNHQYRRGATPAPTAILVTVADQGVFSASNFVLNLLAARWLLPSEYGSYAVAFSLLLIISRLHHMLVIEPMSILGPAKYGRAPYRYIQTVLCLHWALSLGVAPILVVSVLLLPSGLRHTILAMSLAAPLILMQWLLRRACYIETRSRAALCGSCIYSASLFTGLLILHHAGALTPSVFFGIVAGACSLSSFALLWLLGISFKDGPKETEFLTTFVAKQHWAYGKWGIGYSVLDSLNDTGYVLVVAAILGLQGAAAVRALDTLFLPLAQLLTVGTIIFLPITAGRVSGQDQHPARPRPGMAAGVVAIASIFYVSAIAVASSKFGVVNFLLPFYGQFAWLLPYFGAAVILRAVGDCGFGLHLRARGHARSLFWYALIGAICGTGLGLPAMQWLGILGAGLGRLSGGIGLCITSFWCCKRYFPHSSRHRKFASFSDSLGTRTS